MTGIVLLVLYFGVRIGGEVERELAITAFGAQRSAAQASISAYPDDLAADTQERQEFQPQAATGAVEPATIISRSQTAATSEWAAPEPESHEPLATSDSEALPIALLRITRLGLEVPVYADTSERNLNRGAGWVEGTGAPDDGSNMAIAAHRDGYFRVLKDVTVGDILEVESISRRTTYRVSQISIVQPEDISPLAATDTATVTLVTCYPFYFVGHAPQRYIVRAVVL